MKMRTTPASDDEIIAFWWRNVRVADVALFCGVSADRVYRTWAHARRDGKLPDWINRDTVLNHPEATTIAALLDPTGISSAR